MELYISPRHLGCALKCKQMYKKTEPVHIYKSQNTVAFSGTRSVTELSRSLEMFKTEDDVHKGYKKYAEWCKELIDFDLLNTDEPITLTAHSLGAVAATIIATQFPYYTFELVLFGSPKPGGKEFVEDFKTKENISVYNYMHTHDLVQYFPFTNYKQLTEYTFLNHVPSTRNIIANHSIETYIQNMQMVVKNV